MKNEYDINVGIKIKLHKRIPIGGGLGGGSSNAAVTMVGLNKLFNLKIPYTAMRKLAAALGSDVPFFLSGGTALVKGMGDIIEDILLPLDYWLVLIKPDVGISSAWAYENIEPYMIPQPSLDIDKVKEDFQGAHINFSNTFEKLVFNEHPELEEYRDALKAAGSSKALLSGSGSTIYGIFWDKESAELTYERFRKKFGKKVYLGKPVNINYF